MDVIAKFKDAAKELQNDPLYVELAAARKANDEDAALQEKIGEFNLVRMDLNNEMDKEDRNEDKVAQLNERINALYSDIMTNEHMAAYSAAKENMENLFNYVNAILNAAIEGEDPMLVQAPSSGCGAGGCSSCSGCG